MTLAPSAPIVAASAAPPDMLDALLGVFSARGFDGASLAELSRACDRSKASLYHHFPGGKAQMIEVLVSRCAEDLDQRAFQPLGRVLDDGLAANPAKKSQNQKKNQKKNQRTQTTATVTLALEAFLDGFSSYLEAHQGHCLLATLALTQPDLLSPDQSTRLTDWQRLLTRTFEALGHKPKAARRRAQALLARLYGSLTLAAMGSEVSIAQACRWLKKDLLAELG